MKAAIHPEYVQATVTRAGGKRLPLAAQSQSSRWMCARSAIHSTRASSAFSTPLVASSVSLALQSQRGRGLVLPYSSVTYTSCQARANLVRASFVFPRPAVFLQIGRAQSYGCATMGGARHQPASASNSAHRACGMQGIQRQRERPLESETGREKSAWRSFIMAGRPSSRA